MVVAVVVVVVVVVVAVVVVVVVVIVEVVVVKVFRQYYIVGWALNSNNFNITFYRSGIYYQCHDYTHHQ